MGLPLISVVETASYMREVQGILNEDEQMGIVDLLAANPRAGVLIPEGRGIRKLRVGLAGRGKRGGARVIYYYHNDQVPVFLLTVFAKNEQDDLSRKELHAMATIAKAIAAAYGG